MTGNTIFLGFAFAGASGLSLALDQGTEDLADTHRAGCRGHRRRVPAAMGPGVAVDQRAVSISTAF